MKEENREILKRSVAVIGRTLPHEDYYTNLRLSNVRKDLKLILNDTDERKAVEVEDVVEEDTTVEEDKFLTKMRTIRYRLEWFAALVAACASLMCVLLGVLVLVCDVIIGEVVTDVGYIAAMLLAGIGYAGIAVHKLKRVMKIKRGEL